MPRSAPFRHHRLRAVWPWLPLWAAAALLAIFSHGPMPLYSTRTLAVAWEMWSHGHWLVPYINGEPYSEKVPLLFWLIHAGWAVFGVSDVWPRLLEVIFGGLQLVLVARLARAMFPAKPWVARAAPWMLLSLSYAFLFGLQIMYEVLLAVCVLAALNCLAPRPGREEPRWLLFGLCVGAGLLTKGPVMLLHVAVPWLLGPCWSDWAAIHRRRWYGRGALALLLGVGLLLAWALPAGFSGGDAYRQRLFFTQTAGRVVNGLPQAESLQSHAHAAWWYLLWLPVLLFPLSGWLRAVVALPASLLRRPWRRGLAAALWSTGVALLALLALAASHAQVRGLAQLLVCLALGPLLVALLRQPLAPGLRFLLCWPLAVLGAFSLISGKQLYYLLPELGGGAMLLAAAVADLRARHPRLASTAWLGSWPLGLGGWLFAVFLFALPALVSGGHLHGEYLEGASRYSRYFAVIFVWLGGWLLLRGPGEMRRVCAAGLIGILAVNSLFTLGLWSRYDLRPASRLLGRADAAGHAIANLGSYEGQYHFQGRIMHPISVIHSLDHVAAFAKAHPDGLVITYPRRPDAADLHYALLVQPFRGDTMAIWPAAALAEHLAGRTPPEPRQPTEVHLAGISRQAKVQP